MSDLLVLATGGFDPLHTGHIRLFKEAKILGDRLMVGLNSDAWLIRKKNKFFMSFEERFEILSSIKYIDSVCEFDDSDDTAVNLISKINQSFANQYVVFFGNGGDRNNETTPEVEYCLKNKIELIWNLGGDKIQSSSDLLQNW